MRILFISDFSLTQRAGGAQVSNDIILKKGRQLGHDITEHNHSSSITDFLSSYDLVINSNLEMISKISPEKYDVDFKEGFFQQMQCFKSYIENRQLEWPGVSLEESLKTLRVIKTMSIQENE